MQFNDLLQETGELPCHAAPDLFFEQDRHSSDPMSTASRYRAAKALCNDCPIRQQCLSYAMTQKIMHGVWGQTTPFERSLIRQA